MEGKAAASDASAAAPVTLSDSNRHAIITATHAHESMRFDFSERLLTPENSRSETSSNTESAPVDENPTPQRRCTRVPRVSLQEATRSKHYRSDSDSERTLLFESGTYNGFAEADVGVTGEGKPPSPIRYEPSVVRYGFAEAESTQWRDITLTGDNATLREELEVPDTPISNSPLHELETSDMNVSSYPRALRKRREPTHARDEDRTDKEAQVSGLVSNVEPLRRSARLSLKGKSSSLAGQTNSNSRKRSRDAAKTKQTAGRWTNLRPRKIIKVREEPATPTANVPPVKKRHLSNGYVPNLEPSVSTCEYIKPIPRRKTKLWLSHGLYVEQLSTGSSSRRGRGRRTTNEKRSTSQQRKFLPMPVFSGAMLLQEGRDFKLPFDVFSPLPSHRPKPDEWRKINKNVFVGEAGSIWRANKCLELSKCLCTEETGCDENCQNRYMFYECDNSNCGLGKGCGNRSFEELKHRTKTGGKYNIGVEVIKTPDRGYGVRSNRTFVPNQIIVEYTGEILTQAECERRMRTVYKNDKCYYLMYFDQNMVIDATRGSIARFVNHSCDPNCRMEKWTVSGKPRMALFAGDRGIMTGEELSYDYNFDPYSQKNVQECRCGSENCRGVLGPRSKEKTKSDDKGANATPALVAGAKRKKPHDNPPIHVKEKTKSPSLRPGKTGIKAAAAKTRSTARSTTVRKKIAAKKASSRKDKTISKKATARSKRGTRAKANVKAKRPTKSHIVKQRGRRSAIGHAGKPSA